MSLQDKVDKAYQALQEKERREKERTEQAKNIARQKKDRCQKLYDSTKIQVTKLCKDAERILKQKSMPHVGVIFQEFVTDGYAPFNDIKWATGQWEIISHITTVFIITVKEEEIENFRLEPIEEALAESLVLSAEQLYLRSRDKFSLLPKFTNDTDSTQIEAKKAIVHKEVDRQVQRVFKQFAKAKMGKHAKVTSNPPYGWQAEISSTTFHGNDRNRGPYHYREHAQVGIHLGYSKLGYFYFDVSAIGFGLLTTYSTSIQELSNLLSNCKAPEFSSRKYYD